MPTRRDDRPVDLPARKASPPDWVNRSRPADADSRTMRAGESNKSAATRAYDSRGGGRGSNSGGEPPTPAYEMVWRVLRPVLIWLAAIVTVAGLAMAGWRIIDSVLFAPMDMLSDQPVKVEIARGSSVSSIGRQLVEAELIRNKGVFQYYTEFLGMSGKLKAGTYELSQDMTIHQIITELSMGDGGQQTMNFTLIEGMTIEEMALSLVNQRVLTNTRVFLDLCASGEAFAEDYDFIAKALALDKTGRRYQLEGYLFPDTYNIYVGSSEETIIRKMLDRTREIYNLNFINQAEEDGRTMDEVLTLASLIEKEAKIGDFRKVSAVFFNRLKKNQRLESCVTVQYALKVKRLALTADDLAVNSPYNTYQNGGLPVGPVSNPGREAIHAALFPDEEYVEEGYLFFCSKDPDTGELHFSKTLKEHQEISDLYRPIWRDFDERNKAAAQ